MRMRSTFGVALLLGCFGVVAAANPAYAAPKKKKKAEAAAPAVEPEPAKDKSVDDLMSDSATAKPKAAADSGSASESKADEEPVGEPDAWERPPKDEEKPKPTAAAKA